MTKRACVRLCVHREKNDLKTKQKNGIDHATHEPNKNPTEKKYKQPAEKTD